MRKTLFFQRPLPYAFYNATIILVVLNVVIFLLRYLAPYFQEEFIDRYLLLVPNDIQQLKNVWALFTYMFVHADAFHIIFNMIALLLFGNVIEHKLGSHEFLLYYFLTGILAGVLMTFVHPLIGWGDVPVVGASGAIYALLLAYATFFPQNKLLIWGLIPVKAYILVIGLTIFSIIGPFIGLLGNVAFLGHLGGIIFGFLYFPIRLRINPIKEIIYTRRYYQ